MGTQLQSAVGALREGDDKRSPYEAPQRISRPVEDFFTRNLSFCVLVGVVLAQVVLLGYQVRQENGVRMLRVWAAAAVVPVERGLSSVTHSLAAAWNQYVWLVGAREENEHLKKLLTRAKLENLQLQRSLERFEREEVLERYRQDLPSTTILARVIGVGASFDSREVFLDQGEKQGVRAGMAVIMPEGVVGSVEAAFGNSSLVRLIDDAEAAVGVVLVKSRAHGVLKGSGPSEGRLDYVDRDVPVEVGESVFTSGGDRIYPRGLPVGEVVRLDDGDDFKGIHVRPFAPLSRLEEVLVVTAGAHQHLPLEATPQAPEFLMPLPENSVDPVVGAAANAPGTEEGHPIFETEADRLRKQYQAVADAQGHKFGEGDTATPPPNFNLGVVPAEPFNIESGQETFAAGSQEASVPDTPTADPPLPGSGLLSSPARASTLEPRRRP